MAASDTTLGITEGAGKIVGTRTVDGAHREKVCIGGAEDGESYIFLPLNDAADAGSPLKVGGRASLALPSAVSADGDRVNARFTREGALATVATPVAGKVWVDGTGLVTTQFTCGNSSLNNAATTAVVAGGSGVRIYVTSVMVVCTAFTGAGYVTLRDGASTNILPVGGLTAVNTSAAGRAPDNSFLCFTSANTAVQIFFSGNGSVIWGISYYQAP